MRLALVSPRMLTNQWGEIHIAVSDALIDYIGWCGYTPLVLPLSQGLHLESIVSDLKPELIIFSGGESLGENPKRDSFELELLQICESRMIPVLGICRGMQILVSRFGVFPTRLEGHAGTVHDLHGEVEMTVNSYHNFGLLNVPPEFEVLSRASDGSVEMIRHMSLPWLGTMWHPEREQTSDWVDFDRLGR